MGFKTKEPTWFLDLEAKKRQELRLVRKAWKVDHCNGKTLGWIHRCCCLEFDIGPTLKQFETWLEN